MLAQDPYSGYVHEIPDAQAYGQVVYDGLGNPVGFLPGIFDAVKGLVSNIPLVGGLVSNLIPGSAPAPAAAVPAQALPMPALPVPPMPFPGVNVPGLPQIGQMFSNLPGATPLRRCGYPVGWTTSALPYSGTAPRRLYLRCSVWPGQSGLVPVEPGQWPAPATPQQAATQQAMALGMGRRRHRRRR